MRPFCSKDCRSRPGLALGGLTFIIYLSIFLWPAPETQSTHERTLELVSGADFGATCIVFRAGARPMAPGARRGPQGAEHWPKNPGPDLSFYPL